MPPSLAPTAPIAIEARDLEKSFRIPTHRVDSLKERLVRPFASRDYRRLRALDGVSFEIGQGEFFGIVGRNGSGKSTLLKLLASIYRADAGRIRMAGRPAPFIELGVGFNTELTARENIVLNGVMMGLTPAETRARLDQVLDFAELHDFAELRLKNYSSGMLVRLAFSVMMQADADILLIDEVLAVGDAAFQQKCADAFHEMKAAGKTIVLVTHEMGAVEAYCHRAMLIDGGRVKHLGDPAEVGRRYLRLNFERGVGGDARPPAESEHVRLLDARVEDAAGAAVEAVQRDDEVRLRVELEALREIDEMEVSFMLTNANGIPLFPFATRVREDSATRVVRAGERVTVLVSFQNRFTPGRYFVNCGINRARTREVLLHVHNGIDFVVFGDSAPGAVDIPHRISSEVRGGDG